LLRATGKKTSKRKSACNFYIFEHLATPRPQYH
jgi:hypothetical protein